MTVAELNRRMSSREFGEWMEFYKSEPFGPVRDNLHSGQITAMLYNVNRRKGARAMSAADFLLMSERERMQRTTKKTLAAVKALAQPKRKKKRNVD
jgi:hypothetical protein